MDNVDKRIIKKLRENGRVTNNEIAGELAVSEGTIRNRIKKLVENGNLAVKGLLNPCKVQDKQIVILGIKVALSKNLTKVAKKLVTISEVSSVLIVSGRYDLLVELFINPQNLIDFISNDLAKVDSIDSTESFVTLKSINKWV